MSVVSVEVRRCGGIPALFRGNDDLLASRLKFTDKRNNVPAEMLDFFLEVQKAEQDEARAGILERKDALGDLVRRTDQIDRKPSLY